MRLPVTLRAPKLCPNPAGNSVTSGRRAHVSGEGAVSRPWPVPRRSSECTVTGDVHLHQVPPMAAVNQPKVRRVRTAFLASPESAAPRGHPRRRRSMPHVMPLQADDPRRVGRYRLTGRIAGRAGAGGGTQRVFMAKMVDDGAVIVTLLGRERVADAAARDRFTAEARVARRVAPFCAARILDAGIEAHVPYLVTEYVPGSTLVETVWREGPLTSPGLDAVAIGTATGLMAIHQTGLVHGSLGPDRVVLGPDGPCLTQFGITPPYGAATPAADLLAWANTVLFAALGRPPVGPQDLAALDEDLREVVAACLAPDPAARPVARAVLARLLSGHDLSAGLLTEGARQARR